ncbi:Pre-mRNA-splicing factor 18 [Rhynchospora pubera]|uniref:Pre-mRNA-splicing factor 18 n=1 Tax=Rhynchospora pubera TaxID=906938 RepID=A0AAV8ERI7_9POAL|nr:Pre-mRNA-splicing factor 18 [Rhynchospora pubera]
MDLLKRELQKKRQNLAADFGGKKLLRRSEIEQKEIQKLREDEHRSLLAKSSSSRLSTPHPGSTTSVSSSASSNPTSTSSAPPSSSSSSSSSNPNSSSTHPESLPIDDLVLPRHEVVRRLRILKQPITLFGEDDAARLERLKVTMKTGIIEIDSDMTEGQTNDFLRDIYELRKRQKSGAGGGSYMKKDKGIEMDGMGIGGGEADGDQGEGDKDLVISGDEGEKDDKDGARMSAKFEDLCDEDKILVFFKRLLNEWKQELNDMTEIERRSAKGKSIFATFKQCARYLTPLFKFCRKKILPDDIRQALMVVVDCCMKRDYLAAMDQYIKLAIGNAPWPIGVTMVGIHERSAREKIYTNSVAHIMNDETTRKYLQSIKRLMTFCQRRYPANPSKSVEFNSLANGSDLHSLLSQPTDERLRLMPAEKD